MPKEYTYTTQAELRKAFRQDHPGLDFNTIKDHSGKGRMYKADTRFAFIEWIDYLERDGQISEALAQRVTL